VLSVVDLHTFYGDSHVLHGVTLTLEQGTVTAVLGRNGVGKTTLCRSVAALTPPRSGRIMFRDVDITLLPPHAICRMGISLVPQGRRIFPSLTVEENLTIATNRRTTTGWTVAKIFELFPRLGERRRNRGNELSGGEQQMLAIGRALAANPTVLVMDEPTEGLAPMMVATVGTLIRRLRDEGLSILLVEQNAAFAVKFADYIHVLSKGRIVHASTPAALWADEDVKAQYLGVPPTPRAG
jgi:branched-chain amino acid transport system ATP-binding protein